MTNDIFIEYLNKNIQININELNITNDNNLSNQSINVYSVKENNNMIYQDILIEMNNTFIIVQIYKLKSDICNNITHGTFIIYQKNDPKQNNSNILFYTKNNSDLILSKIDDTYMIYQLHNSLI